MSLTRQTQDRFLVLDDAAEIAELIGELATQAGFVSTVTTDIAAFNTAIERDCPSVIALDLQMPETDGIEVLRQLSSMGCTARIFLISGMDKRTVVSAERFGREAGLNLLGAVQKPFDPEALVEKLKQARSLTEQLSAEEFGTAIQDATLVLRYQPVLRRIGPRSWHAESVEALPRWHHPEYGILTPRQFLPLIGSERGLLMRQLTDFVFQQGIEQLRQWQNVGVHLGLRVNVAAGLISDIEFPNRLENLLDQHGTDPALLTLEISDASCLAKSCDGIEILTRLRLKGMNLALDDFGVNGSALQGIYALPVNEVKIDGAITGDLTREQGATIVFRGILNILRELDIICCAKGVESSEQLRLLDELGCDLVQGFHISTPLPAEEIPKALASWTADAAPRMSSAS